MNTIFEDLYDYENLAEYLYVNLSRFNYQRTKLGFFEVEELWFNTQEIPTEIIKTAIKEGIQEPHNADNIAWHFATTLHNYFEIISANKFESQLIEKPKTKTRVDYTLRVKEADFRLKQGLETLSGASNSVQLKFGFSKTNAKNFQKELHRVIQTEFAPTEDEIINFYEYISELKLIHSQVKIPFSAFEKIQGLHTLLKFLELQSKVKVKSWIGTDEAWEVIILSPEIMNLYVPRAYLQSLEPSVLLAQKTNSSHNIALSLDEEKRVLSLNEAQISLNPSKHQFDLLKVCLSEKPIDFDLDFSEIAEAIEPQFQGMPLDKQISLKKRYANAVYQLNRKIAIKTEYKELFICKSSMVRFNPKYEFTFS